MKWLESANGLEPFTSKLQISNPMISEPEERLTNILIPFFPSQKVVKVDPQSTGCCSKVRFSYRVNQIFSNTFPFSQVLYD